MRFCLIVWSLLIYDVALANDTNQTAIETLLPINTTAIINDNPLDLEKRGDWTVLPYFFSSDSTGLTGGIAAIATGLFQPQSKFVVSLFRGVEQEYSTNREPDRDSFSGGGILFENLKIPYTNRFFFSFFGVSMFKPQNEFYIDSSNDSSSEDALLSSGTSQFFYSTIRYVLPIGEGIDNPEGVYNLKDGFVMHRDSYGNGIPFETGRTALGLKTFYQHRDIENWLDFPDWQTLQSKPSWDSRGIKLFFNHDNTDFDLNPTRGYSFELQYSQDFKSNLDGWNFIEFKYSKYFPLTPLAYTQQSVLALNLWSGYSPSWDDTVETLPSISAHRPPLSEGANLGGMNRMRAYDSNRFMGKAVLYGCVEYRNIIDYNPFKSTFLSDYTPIEIDWFQIVAFAEVGRVNNIYNLDLIDDMKYDVGISLRAMAAGLPVRFDVAYGQEGVDMWVMVQHPFDF